MKLFSAVALKGSRSGIRRVNIKHKDFACCYDNGDHRIKTTVKHAVSVAVRRGMKTVKGIGSDANPECAGIIFRSREFISKDFRSAKDLIAHEGCCHFKRIDYFGALRGDKNFMTALADRMAKAQVNIIHHIRHWSELGRYQPAQ